VANDALLQLAHVLSFRVVFLHCGFLPSCRARPTHIKVKKEVCDIHRRGGYCMLTSLFLHQELVNQSLNLCYGTKWSRLLPSQKSVACRDSSSLGTKNNPENKQVFCGQVTWFFYTIFYFYFIYLFLDGCAVCAMVMEAVHASELSKINGKSRLES